MIITLIINEIRVLTCKVISFVFLAHGIAQCRIDVGFVLFVKIRLDFRNVIPDTNHMMSSTVICMPLIVGFLSCLPGSIVIVSL